MSVRIFLFVTPESFESTINFLIGALGVYSTQSPEVCVFSFYNVTTNQNAPVSLS